MGDGFVNPFRLCTGLRVLGYLVLPIVAGIAAACYYAVIIVAWGPRIVGDGHVSGLALVILFHLLLVMLTWCYIKAVFSDPGTVPADWRPPVDEETGETSTRYCDRCQRWKPPRCHHCSVCDKCVLKMDHHCVWVVNCVGARTYKFFLLFVVYTFLEMTLCTFALLPHFFSFFYGNKRRNESTGNLVVTFVAFILSVAFALSLLCFSLMHISLVLSNTTSIEVYEKKREVSWKYDVGKRKNFEQVFGTKKLLWFLPLYSSEDLENISALKGLEFPTCSEVV
ncbi:hypothetical protein LUZ60_007651 [Juncus effusus]|nr:hypothetical protein LUZ60_007651 [Juncus effusus]